MNCITVDDDMVAQAALNRLISKVDFLVLKRECSNPIEAFNILKKDDIDIVFLDVEMPEISGIDLIRNLKKKPVVILITASKEYAVEAFELNVADYIVKPVSLVRFMEAVSKAKEIIENKGKMINKVDKDYIFIRSNSKLSKINLSEILFIEAKGDYVHIYTSDQRHIIHATLKSIQEKLPSDKFFRVHRSFLIALDKIDNVEGNRACVNKHSVPIGDQLKQTLLKKLNLI